MKYSIIVVLSGLAAMTDDLSAQQAKTRPHEEVFERVLLLLDTEDSFQATAYIEKQGPPEEVPSHYSRLVRELYAKQRDVPRMLFIGRAGVDYCLREAARRDGEQAEQLRSTAKAMAYNLSVNAWPGWEEPGVEITRTDSVLALDFARLNLRLARELNRDADVLGNAHWLVGAQHLALQQRDGAIQQFSEAVKQFAAANKPDYERMAAGYRAIARMTADATREQGRKELTAALETLRTLGTEDANFFATQLEDVANHFAG